MTIQIYMTTKKKRGRPPTADENFSIQIWTRISKSDLTAFEQACKERNLSTSLALRVAIKKMIRGQWELPDMLGSR